MGAECCGNVWSDVLEARNAVEKSWVNVMAMLLTAAVCVGAVSACHNPITALELTSSNRAIPFYAAESNVGWLGDKVDAAGDVNGDGFDDVLITEPFALSHLGIVYLIFGRSQADWAITPVSTFDFSNFANSPNESSWIKITGIDTDTQLGINGIAHGDFNNDGLSDFVLSTGNAGAAFVVYGHTGDWYSFGIESIVGVPPKGFKIWSSYTASGPTRVGNAGDLNGDGIEDLLVRLVAVPFVIFGASHSDFDLVNIDGLNGFKITGESSTALGDGVYGSVGDVNGDGLADLAIGDRAANNVGYAYIIFARNLTIAAAWHSVFAATELDGITGFIVAGSSSTHKLGLTVVGAGDLNDDGFDDIYIGSNSVSEGAWVVFGHAGSWNSMFSEGDLVGPNGFQFASSSDENWGWSGGKAGDVNGDGIDDLIIGGDQAYNFAGVTQTGAVVVIFGRHQGVSWPANIARSEVIGSVGFQIDGISYGSKFGISARSAGDLNGDGVGDVIIGAYLSGFATLVFGVDDHCAVCNTGSMCDLCRDGYVLNGTICKRNNIPAVSSSSFTHDEQYVSSLSASSSTTATSGMEHAGSTSSTTIIVETDSGASVAEVSAELAVLLGSSESITVVEVTPGTFEITIQSDIAQQLVDAIHQCMNAQ